MKHEAHKIELVVPEDLSGMRIDRLVSGEAMLSRAMAQQLIAQGNVLVNGKKPAKSHVVLCGDVLSVCIPPPQEVSIHAQDIPLCVVYEDAHLLVVDKPKGIVVHPAAGNPDGTLVNALMHHCEGQLSGIGGELRPGIVHRIDKDTSGLLVVAKSDAAHKGLAVQFEAHSIDRVYYAVAHGRFRQTEGCVDEPIGRSRNDRKKMAVSYYNSKTAVTHYSVVEQFEKFTLLKLRLQTGRTHQIRVHMAHISHPLAGDVVYGPSKLIKSLRGQCLHAGRLGFVHPISGEQLSFESELPEYFTDFLAKISAGTWGKNSGG